MERNKNNQLLKLGEVCMLKLTSGAVISGVLIGKAENVIKDKIEVCYRFVISRTQHIDLLEDDIEQVIYSPRQLEKLEYFKGFEKKHDVKCFDSDDNLLPASVIMGNSLIRGNVWDKLSETERMEFINQIELEDKDIVDLIKACVMTRKENEKLYNDKEKILNATSELVKNYKNAVSCTKNIYDVLFKELGLEKFINTICLR